MRTLIAGALIAVGLVALCGATVAAFAHCVLAGALIPAGVLACGAGILVLRRGGTAARDPSRAEPGAPTGEVLASLNHEVMNVLAPVTMFLDVARRGCSGAEAAKAIDSAQSRLRELTRLGDELRDYYREPKLSPVAISLADAVASCLAELAAAADDGWSPPELVGLDVKLRADPQKLKKVLLSVLENAREAMADVERKAWSVRASVADGRARIEVRDSGVGLAPEEAAKAFDLFRSTKPRSGAGLGLAVARRIAEAHGGEITMSGEPGRGATVMIAWPLADSA